MRGISEKEYAIKLEKIQKDNLAKERAKKLKEEKKKGQVKHKLPSVSKMVLLGMIILCIQIVIFCEYIMVSLGDTSALYVLIGIPAALSPIIWGYFSKSKAENTAGGIVYDTVMAEIQAEHDIDSTDDYPVG